MCSPCQHLASSMIALYDGERQQGTELENLIRTAPEPLLALRDIQVWLHCRTQIAAGPS